MVCKKCNYKGYVEFSFFANNKENKSVKVCPYCNDTRAYSRYIKSKYSNKLHILEMEDEGQIIDLLEFKKKREK